MNKLRTCWNLPEKLEKKTRTLSPVGFFLRDPDGMAEEMAIGIPSGSGDSRMGPIRIDFGEEPVAIQTQLTVEMNTANC